MNDRPGPNLISAAPVFLVRDIQKSVKWYTEKLKFTVDKIWGDPPSFAMADKDGVTVMLKQSASGPRENNASLSGMWDAYIWVRDIKKVETSLRSAGVSIDRGPETSAYGCEELEVHDPDGHLICFGYCPE